jgi:membrane protease YdiL (CAAX protease family)
MNKPLFLRPKFQVIVTWLWFILLPLSLVGILVVILQLEISTMRSWWSSNQYFQAYFETALAGLLPIIFFVLNKEKLTQYGLRQEGLVPSVALSLGLVTIFFSYSYLTTGNWINHSDITADLSIVVVIWYMFWGIFANGPLELFFYIFLLEKTDEIFNSDSKLLSKGFWITTSLHALVHIITTQSISNTVAVFVIFFCLGLIYRTTKNAIGPMLGWTLINGMVWAFITMPWS